MILLITPEQQKALSYKDLIPLQCKFCQKIFYRRNKYINAHNRKPTKFPLKFCSHKCHNDFSVSVRKKMQCKNCNKEIKRTPSSLVGIKNVFCSHKCAGTYNSQYKTSGYRRSKLEIWLEIQLLKLFTNLKILFNNREAVGLELDIYLPNLSLAFELNGIFHYEPIYGSENLLQIKDRDQRKFQACISKNIELCILDTSFIKYFKHDSAQKFLDIIVNIINEKQCRINNEHIILGAGVEIESTIA